MICPAQVVPHCEVIVLIVEGFFEQVYCKTVVAVMEVVFGFVEVELGDEAKG
jgi:hypothetical protein